MKLSVILVSFLVAFISLNQSFAEVYTTGSAADNNGNIIVIGFCLGNVRIAGDEYTITTPSAFILKLNSEGEKIWIKFINSTESIKANAVAIDSSGNIYLTGEFSGTVDFGGQVLISDYKDLFVVKVDSLCSFIWSKKTTGNGNEFGKDIGILDDESIAICGYSSSSFSYDNLNLNSGGFTLKINSAGSGFFLQHTHDDAYTLTVDKESNIIVGGTGNTGYPFYTDFSSISKFDSNGNLLFNVGGYLSSRISLVTGDVSEIYSFNTTSSTYQVWQIKLNAQGSTQHYSTLNNLNITSVAATSTSSLLIQGKYINNFAIGDSTLLSNGLEDAFIAKIDTSFGLIWIKHAGGLFQDEMLKSVCLSDNSILTTAFFRGRIIIDSLEFNGGISSDDTWVALLKFDSSGNLMWLKKIGENSLSTTPKIWFPISVGNKWQYFDFSRYYPISYQYSLVNMAITDSINVNNTKYYKASNFFNFPSGTLIRYDEQIERLLILKEGIEYTFVDFSKMEGETYQQIQPDNSFLQVEATESNIVVFNDTILTKGFYRETNQIYGYYNFAENTGLVNQDEERILLYTNQHDYDIIEYVLNNPEYFHNKHQQIPSIQFQPILFIPESSYLNQNFKIRHRYSILTNSPSYIYGFSYIKNSYLQSFYYNGADTIWNNNFNIPQTTEIDFSLNYQFDTTKYNQGYHLYYRIAAVDKGIVADTFYSPQTGYYKLFWKDTTTSVTQTEFEALTYSLSQNYPNPFNPVSKIVFTIPKRENVSLKVYDILGSEITTLVNKDLDAGKYEVEFSGKDLSSGIYIYQIKAGAFRETKKMILMR